MDMESKLPASATRPREERSILGGGTAFGTLCVETNRGVRRRMMAANSVAAVPNNDVNFIVQGGDLAAVTSMSPEAIEDGRRGKIIPVMVKMGA